MTDSQLAFDQERAAAMLAVYRTPAMVARRREAIDALSLWIAERDELRASGEFFFSLPQFYFVADKPS